MQWRWHDTTVRVNYACNVRKFTLILLIFFFFLVIMARFLALMPWLECLYTYIRIFSLLIFPFVVCFISFFLLSPFFFFYSRLSPSILSFLLHSFSPLFPFHLVYSIPPSLHHSLSSLFLFYSSPSSLLLAFLPSFLPLFPPPLLFPTFYSFPPCFSSSNSYIKSLRYIITFFSFSLSLFSFWLFRKFTITSLSIYPATCLSLSTSM